MSQPQTEHALDVTPAPDAVAGRAAAEAPRPDSLQAMSGALQSCDHQLARVIEVLGRLAEESAVLEHTPLTRRRPWELLARADRMAHAGFLQEARLRLLGLQKLTERFAGAIDLLKSTYAHLRPVTVRVAETSVATHLEICRDNLEEIARTVGQLQAA